MKRLRILVEGSKRPPFKIQIRPYTTARDVLVHLKLNEAYALSPLNDPTKIFTPEEGLYDHITNDEKLIARLSPQAVQKRVAEADKFMEHIAFEKGPI